MTCCSKSPIRKKYLILLLNRTESESSLLMILSSELQQMTFNHINSLPFFLSSCLFFYTRHKYSFVSRFQLFSLGFLSLFHVILPRAPYLMLCICNISGSVALSEATKLPTGMFSILVTVRGSGKKTGPSLMSRTVTWTEVVELGP